MTASNTASTATAGPANPGSSPQGQMSRGRIISYAMGDVANNLSFLMTSMFLMVYMTEIAGVSAGIAGIIYGITKVWAGVSDLIAGQTVDRANTKWGRLRPWLLWISTPIAIVFVLLFSVPAGLNPTMTVVWIFLLDALFQLAYSFVNIPYGSLSAAMTQDPVDRSKLSGARSIAGAVTGVVLAFFIAPQFKDTTGDHIRLQFTLTCLALGALAIVLYLICFRNTRETVPRGSGQISLKNTLTMIGKNTPLKILVLATFFLLSAMFAMNAVAMYYVMFVLGNASWFAWLQLAQTAGSILVASFVPAMTIKLGKRNGYIASALASVVGYLIIFFAPDGSLVTGLIAWFIIGCGVGGANSLIFSMQADTVDYGEWKTGVRAEGGSYSILSFVRKVGQGIGGWAAGALVAAYGYTSGVATQSDQALDGIRMAAGLIPAGLVVVAIVVMSFYRLDAETYGNIVAELNTRRTQSAVAKSKGVDLATVASGTSVDDGRTTLLRSASAPHPPTITIFGQRGSGASDIAPALAKELGVKFIGQKFSSTELAQVDSSELISDSSFSRWMRSVANTGAGDNSIVVATNQSANRELATRNTAEVLDAVDQGGVIMGRNSTLVLNHVYGVMHIRLIAPLEKRIERVMYKTGLDHDAAERQCHAEDRLRQEMSRALYQWNPNIDEYYDLTINTASVTYEQVVEFIADAYRSKYPDNTPYATGHINRDEVPDSVIHPKDSATS